MPIMKILPSRNAFNLRAKSNVCATHYPQAGTRIVSITVVNRDSARYTSVSGGSPVRVTAKGYLHLQTLTQTELRRHLDQVANRCNVRKMPSLLLYRICSQFRAHAKHLTTLTNRDMI
jgi:hypothetical protein